MIYAYVTTESCRSIEAEKIGAEIGRNSTPVEEHGDYAEWPYDERETLQLIVRASTQYQRRAAQAVAELLGWKEARNG
jgi:hypothetical protein